ncbi:hypothetical protein [Amycolatopsis methanolica]|nr:hypothetical protein [Amycolatopsis methanolica]
MDRQLGNPRPRLTRSGSADAGVLLTLRRAAFLTGARYHLVQLVKRFR